jgi:DNA-binding transcriptional ArsR family regulator
MADGFRFWQRSDENRGRGDDVEIFRRLAEFVFLRQKDLSELTGRSRRVVYRRLGKLKERGLVLSLHDPEDKWAQAAWCLSQKGWDKALELRLVEDSVDWEDDRSNKNLPHDLEITKFHLALVATFGEKNLRWHQVGIESEGVRPDALFALNWEGKWRCFILEYENTLRRETRDGENARIAKLRQYVEYAAGRFQEDWEFRNFRLLMVLPTAAKMLNLLERMKEDEELNHPRFWLAARQDLNDVGGRIWYSPKVENPISAYHHGEGYSLVA